MKNLLICCFILLSAAVLRGQSNLKISSAEIKFHFVSKDVEGSIAGFQSASSINLEQLDQSKFEGSVEVGTIKTGNFLRDWSLKSGKYFDEDNHPRIHFISNQINTLNEGIFEVKGQLEMKGIQKPVTFTFSRKDNRFIGLATLYTSDFDIDIKNNREENEVLVTVQLNF